MSANERTGWRCQAISQRHRAWGYNCPSVDLDFVVAEYNHGLPVAIVEYKERRVGKQDFDHPTYQALKSLADNYKTRPLPFFVARYCPDDWWFVVIPLNEEARKWFAEFGDRPMTEQQFVRRLYLLRKRILTIQDEECISALNNILP